MPNLLTTRSPCGPLISVQNSWKIHLTWESGYKFIKWNIWIKEDLITGVLLYIYVVIMRFGFPCIIIESKISRKVEGERLVGGGGG